MQKRQISYSTRYFTVRIYDYTVFEHSEMKHVSQIKNFAYRSKLSSNLLTQYSAPLTG